jgi:glycosyltransferase involved in cell wall biosynthesis
MPLRRKRVMGRTLDRVLHARAVAAKVRELEAESPFHVLEAPEAGLDGEVLATDLDFVERLIISCHGSNVRGQTVGGVFAPVHRLDWWWSTKREQKALGRVHTIIANSEATKQEVLGHNLKVAEIDIVHLGIDTDRFHPGDVRYNEHLEVGFVGRLQEAKGIEFVWRVMEELGPDAGIHFNLVGAIHPSTRRETLKRLKQFRQFAKYHPPVRSGDMPHFYRTLDVLLAPSRFESFGLVYAEAMATGLLVFAGKGGAGPELVSDGQSGFLVDPDESVDAVVERLRVLASDRSAFAEVRRNGRESVGRRFTLEQWAEAKMAVYDRVSRATLV